MDLSHENPPLHMLKGAFFLRAPRFEIENTNFLKPFRVIQHALFLLFTLRMVKTDVFDTGSIWGFRALELNTIEL
jgi:hypothetical protein